MRRRDPKVDRLSKVQLFSACSRADLERIAALTTEIEAPAGKVLMRAGERGHECFVIVSGSAKAELPGGESGTVSEGEVLGELALLDQAPRSATVTAETDMSLVVLNSREFSTLMDDHPNVRQNVLAAVASRIRDAEAPQPRH